MQSCPSNEKGRQPLRRALRKKVRLCGAFLTMTMIRCACLFVALVTSARASAAPVLGLDLPREVCACENLCWPIACNSLSLCSAHHGCQQGSSDDACVHCCCVPAHQICEAPYPIVNVIAEPPAMQPRSLSPRLRGVVAPSGSSDMELYNELADTAHLTDSWKKSQ